MLIIYFHLVLAMHGHEPSNIEVYLFWILTFLITVNDLPSWYLISRVLYFDILWQDIISLGSIFMI